MKNGAQVPFAVMLSNGPTLICHLLSGCGEWLTAAAPAPARLPCRATETTAVLPPRQRTVQFAASFSCEMDSMLRFRLMPDARHAALSWAVHGDPGRVRYSRGPCGTGLDAATGQQPGSSPAAAFRLAVPLGHGWPRRAVGGFCRDLETD